MKQNQSKALSRAIEVKKLIHETLFVLHIHHLGLVQPEIMLLLLCNTGDPKRITYWAEITAPLISNGRCIVYVDFVEDVAPLSMRLREEHGVKAGSFYGRGLSGHDKDEVLKSWRAGVIKVMVATKAFGLGVNQSDVDVVVRIGVPPSMEELVQQFGRAGRDGRAAKGIKYILYFYSALTCTKYVQHRHPAIQRE